VLSISKGPSIKDVHLRVRGFVQRQKGFFTCGRPHFLVRKTGLFEIYGVFARTRVKGFELVRAREKGSIFRDFVRTSFMDGP